MDASTILLIAVAVLIGLAAGYAAHVVITRRAAPKVALVDDDPNRPPSTLADLTLKLAGETATTPLLTRAGEWLEREYRLPSVVIYPYDPATNELVEPLVLGRPVHGVPLRIRMGSGVIGDVARERVAHFVDRVPSEARYALRSDWCEVAYCIPLMHANTLVGVLCVQSDKKFGLAEAERATLDQAGALIGAMASITVRLENSQEAITRFDRFQSVAQRLAVRLETDNLLKDVVEAAREMLDTQMSVLLDINMDTNEMRPIAWAGISDETAGLIKSSYKGDLKGLVAWARRPARTPDLHTDQRTALATQAVAAGMLSEMAAPVLNFDKLFGVLAVETDVHRNFTDEEMNLLMSLAAHAGVALRNAQLFDRLNEGKQALERTVADLEISRQQAENARLSAVEANSLKTQFVNNMSHELRTPLNAVINFTRIVSDGHAGAVTDQQKTYLAYVHDSGQHLLGLINDILDLAKIEAGKMDLRREPTEIEPILKGVMSTAVGLTRDKGLTLKSEIAPNLPSLNIDGTRVRQVLLNLLSNSAKFTLHGGITLSAVQKGDEVVVSVRDTGIGIEPEDIPKVFEEFRQVDSSLQRKETGTGLGMPISRRFVELHGGQMWIESAVGEGTAVFFTLPIAVPKIEAPAPAAPALTAGEPS